MQLAEWIAAEGITARSRRANGNPNIDDMGAGASHWRVTLERPNGNALTVPYSMGSAHRGEPELTDVLDALASDSAGYENASAFEAWAEEYGYSTDSRKAERTFRAVQSQAENLRVFLGVEAYEALLWGGTERQ